MADTGSANCGALQVWEACLFLAEGQSTLRGGQVDVAPDLLFELPAELVGVIVADPGGVGDSRQLVIPELVGLLRPHIAYSASEVRTQETPRIESGVGRTDDPGKAGWIGRGASETYATDRIIA